VTGPFAEDNIVGPTEYGGDAGLVQPVVTPDGGVGHELTPAERLGLARRAAPTDSDAIDPVTGRSALEE